LAAGHIVISAVLDRPLSAPHRELLDQELHKVFGSAMRFDFEPVDAIPRSASGKRRITIGLDG
jgi:hypothetical protein